MTATAPISVSDKRLERPWLASATRQLVMLFFVTTVAVPTTIVNKAVFVLLGVLVLVRVVSRPADSPVSTLSPLVAVAIFLYGFTLSLLGNADPELANQFVLSVAVLFLIYPATWYDIDLDYLAKLSGLVIVGMTGLFVASILAAPVSGVAAAVALFFVQNNLGFSAGREFLDDSKMTYALATGSFLLLPFALFVESFIERRRVWAGVAAAGVAVAMFLSGSRALMLTGLMAVAYLAFRRGRTVPQVVVVVLGAPVILYALAIVVSATNVFSATEVANSIKIGHLQSFLDHVTLSGSVFGEGLASYYFSSGRATQVAITEITLLDSLRYLGFILTPLLYAALLFPSLQLDRYRGDGVRSVAIFLLYLVLSLSNPVLFNSAGLLVVVWYWRRILRRPESLGIPALETA